jgi:hypothetical protein
VVDIPFAPPKTRPEQSGVGELLSGKRKWRFDYAIPDKKLCLEYHEPRDGPSRTIARGAWRDQEKATEAASVRLDPHHGATRGKSATRGAGSDGGGGDGAEEGDDMNREAKAKVRLQAAWWEAQDFIPLPLSTGRVFAQGMFRAAMDDWLTPQERAVARRYWRRYFEQPE